MAFGFFHTVLAAQEMGRIRRRDLRASGINPPPKMGKVR